MGTKTVYPARMGRHKYEPPPDVAKRAAALLKAQTALEAAEDKFQADLIALHGEGDVPVAYLAEVLGRDRKGVYRAMGRRMP